MLYCYIAAVTSSPVKQQSSAAVVPASPAKSDTDYHNDSSHDPHYEPIIELPPEVDVVTGMYMCVLTYISQTMFIATYKNNNTLSSCMQREKDSINSVC